MSSPGEGTDGPGGDGPPQLQIFGTVLHGNAMGTLSEGEEEWRIEVAVERISRDLFHGRLTFQNGEVRHLTAPILIEESEERVLQRARELPEAMVRQLLASARA